MIQILLQAKSRKNLNLLGAEVVKTIRNRTLQGIGVKEFKGRSSKLKKLKASTISRRKRFKGLSPSTTPDTSNLTFTGALLKAIKFKLKLTGLRIFIGKSEQKKANYVQTVRPFFTLSKVELETLLSYFKRILRRR